MTSTEWKEPVTSAEPQLPGVKNAASALREAIQLPLQVIAGVLHEGCKLVLGGSSKSYKTWLLLDLGVCVSAGLPWLNGYTTRRGRVLFVNFELPEAFCFERIRRICDEYQITPPDTLDVWNVRGYSGQWRHLASQIPQGDYRLVVLDPTYKLLLGRDENKAGDIASLMDEFERVAVRTGSAIAFGAHYSKGNQSQKDAIDRIGGSGVFARDPDSILTFTRHREEDCFSVEMTLRNHAPQEPFVVRWEYPIFTVDATLEPGDLKQPGRPREYRHEDVLNLVSGEMSSKEIVEAARAKMGISERQTKRMLRELTAEGKLKQDDSRKYARVNGA